MNEFFSTSVYAGAVLSLAAFEIGILIKKKLKHPLFNPLLIGAVITIAFLVIFKIDYESYNYSAKYIGYFLTPATVCLAIPLYEQFELLKKNYRAVLAGIVTGVITSLVTVLVLALLLKLDHKEYITFLPKSVTSAIGMVISEELGGYVAITVPVIVITGILGSVIGESVFKIFNIHNPIARGIALGSASHAIGTSKAMELGEIEGAMSSLSIVVSGLLTVIGAAVFSNFI